jgi:prepilin-type N-terminal cleavage/methylation domain-containing protein/prepilin-type processing-associated H-X9-DG protein
MRFLRFSPPVIPVLRFRRNAGGFTLTELLVVIAIIGILAALIIPVVGKTRDAAKNSKCLTYMRQIGTLTQLYIADNRGMIPPVKNEDVTPKVEWFQYFAQYLDDATMGANYDKRRELLFGCPGFSGGADNASAVQSWIPGYALNRLPGLPSDSLQNWVRAGLNARRFNINEITMPTRRILFGESSIKSHVGGIGDIDTLRHGDHSNALYFDLHVGSLAPTTAAVNAAFNGTW